MSGVEHIAFCSGGKDSVATLILAKEHGEPLDEVVYCEVMFDENTSGEMPEHIDFVINKVKPFVENVLNVPFIHLRSEKTYTSFFNGKISRGNNKGKAHGFPIPGMCSINRDCKLHPIRQHLKSKSENIVQYVGIAADEPIRLVRLQGTNKISLLDKYGVTEAMAAEICKQYGLYSPIYNITNRNGCWFCMNCKDAEWKHLMQNHSELFEKLVQLEAEQPDRSRTNLTRNETPTQIKKRLTSQSEQIRFF